MNHVLLLVMGVFKLLTVANAIRECSKFVTLDCAQCNMGVFEFFDNI